MKHTIRGRKRARTAGQSLKDAVPQVLAEGVGLPQKRRDLSDLVGTWKADEEFEAAIVAQDQVDEDFWK